MKTKHRAEPLRANCNWLETVTGKPIAIMAAGLSVVDQRANAARLAECWNACREISDPADLRELRALRRELAESRRAIKMLASWDPENTAAAFRALAHRIIDNCATICGANNREAAEIEAWEDMARKALASWERSDA